MLAAFPDQPLDGRATYVSPSLNADTRSAVVRVVVANESGLLRPGMFARVELEAPPTTQPADPTATTTTPLAIPQSAVQTFEGKTVVFVPVDGEPNTFTPRAVKLGTRADGRVAVVEGLSAGQAIVVEGAFLLKAELAKGEAAHDHGH
jgi:multidrug efflux pump subunit AcrA (membrane-fusion protein)